MKAEVDKVTVDTLPEVNARMRKYGWAILRNAKEVFSPQARFTKEQMKYIDKLPMSSLDVVFEGVTLNSQLDHYVPHIGDGSAPNARLQLEPSAARKEYTKLYSEQLRNIIEGYHVYEGEERPIDFDTHTRSMRTKRAKKVGGKDIQPRIIKTVPGLFPRKSKAGQFENWIANANMIKGGVGYQHPHSDQGRCDEFNHLDIFPFSILHAFGQKPFDLWVLPQPDKRTYGFLHTFEQENMVFLRGDFVHAGGVGVSTRGFMDFYPRPEAGWFRSNSWWNHKLKGNLPTFLFQQSSFPFGYPCPSEANKDGDIVITYPPDLTTRLALPLTAAMSKAEGIYPYVPEGRVNARKRKVACCEVAAQAW
jgi:hypothetical protein